MELICSNIADQNLALLVGGGACCVDCESFTGHRWPQASDLVADAKLEASDDDVRRAVGNMSKPARDLLLKRRDISVADFEAKEIKVPAEKWADLRKDGGPPTCTKAHLRHARGHAQS